MGPHAGQQSGMCPGLSSRGSRSTGETAEQLAADEDYYLLA
jgi:hypothetical protein